MNNQSLKKTLFEESSLKELLLVYESVFPEPIPAKMIGGWCGILVFLLLIISWYVRGIDAASIQDASALLASYALTVSSALMGVVIAGMSIFAASLRPKVANGMIETVYPGSQVSSLKFVFAMFAYVLFHLFVLISMCGFYYLALADKSITLSVAGKIYHSYAETAFFKFSQILYVSVLTGTILFLGSLLRSFIWNLHQVLLVVAVFNGHAADPKD